MSTLRHRWSRVSRTAIGVARVRARESARPDALFEDPYAAALVDALAETPPGSPPGGAPSRLTSALAFHIVIRTRFYDELLLDACDAGCRQVVLLAAGLDTRAFRLAWPPGVRLYELDLPEVIAAKDEVLDRAGAASRCRRTSLGVDLRDGWRRPLLAAGFAPAQATAWLAEGLLVYLGPAEAAGLLAAVTGLSAPGSSLAFERGSAAVAMRGSGGDAGEDGDSVVSLWRGGLGDEAEGWLRARGWEVRFSGLGPVARSWGRPSPVPTGSGFLSATLPVTRTRR